MNNTCKSTTLALLTLITINGCGGGSSTTGSNTGKQPTVEVKYTLNGTQRPTCHNADRTGELNPTPIDYVICDWYCGSYQGSDTVEVELIFQKVPKTEEGIWELSHENLKEANSKICKDI